MGIPLAKECDREQSQVAKQLAEFVECLPILQDRLGDLAARLSPVLRPEPPPYEIESSKNPKDSTELVPLADTIYGLKLSVRGAILNVENILSRIEL